MKNISALFIDLIAKGADISAIADCLECSVSVAGICLTAGAVGLSVAQHLHARKAEQSDKQRDEEILDLIARLAEQAHKGDTAILTFLATDREACRTAYEKFASDRQISVDDIRLDDLRRPHFIQQRFLEDIRDAVDSGILTTLQVGDKILDELKSFRHDLLGKHANPLSWQQQLQEYGEHFAHRFDKLRISALGGGEERDSVFTLSGLYVEPAIDRLCFQTAAERLVEDKKDIVSQLLDIRRTTQRYEKSLDMFTHPEVRRHILLGGAGTGKSSVLRHLVLDWNRRRKAGTPAGPAPILVEVREFLGARDQARKNAIGDKLNDPLAFLTSPCERTWCFDRNMLIARLDSGDAILILDGLDEAFDPEVRDTLSDWLRGFARQHPRARILASSRDNVFIENDWPRENIAGYPDAWAIHTLVPFDKPRIATFLHRWYDAQALGADNTKVLRDDLHRAIRDLPFLQPLAEVPLTLTMLCILGHNNISPESRTDVFNKATSLFIRQWDDARGLPKGDAHIIEKFRNYGEKPRHLFFRNVALKMIEAGNLANSNRISRGDLRAILVGYFKGENSDDSNLLADGILRLLCERNFLLTQLASGEYAFFHRAFMEYYTALAWADQFANNRFRDPDWKKSPEDLFFEKIILPRLHDETWSDTFHFLIGMMSPTPARAIIETIANLSSDDLDKFGKNPDVEGDERALAAKLFATELARDLQPDSDQDGRAIGGREVAAGWKVALLEFAWSGWGGSETSRKENDRRRVLRGRALHAVAALWQGDHPTAAALADGLLLDGGFFYYSQLGKALAIAAPGQSAQYHLLLDIINAPHRAYSEKVRPGVAPAFGVRGLAPAFPSVLDDGELRQITTGKPAQSRSVSHESSELRDAADETESGVKPPHSKASRHSPAILDNQPHTPAERLHRFTHHQDSASVRHRAIGALRGGWSADAEAKAAILRAAIGVPEQNVPPDRDFNVRRFAIHALGAGWSGDSEAKAAILRAAIGVPEQQIPPDDNRTVRWHAIDALRRGCSGDSEVGGKVRRAVENSIEKLGADHVETRRLRKYLEQLSRG